MSEEELLAAARGAAAARDWEAAVEKWQAYLAFKPNSSDALIGLSTALRKLHRYDEGEEILKTALKTGPSEKAFLLQVARNSYSRGDFDKSVSCWAAVITVDPSHFESHLKKGIAHQKLGQGEDAARHIAFAQEISPHHPELLKPLLQCQIDTRDTSGFVDSFKIYKKRLGKVPSAPIEIVELLIEAGDLDVAEELIGKIGPTKAEDVRWADARLSIEMKRGHWVTAAGLMVRQFQTMPSRVGRKNIWSALRHLYDDPAMRMLAISILAAPVRQFAVEFVHQASREGRLGLALDLIYFIDKEALDDVLNERRADILTRLFRFEEAESLIGTWLKVNPTGLPALVALARLQESRLDWIEAVSTRQQIRILNPAELDNLLALADAYLATGAIRLAEEVLLSGLQIGQIEVRWLIRLGGCELRAGRFHAARSWLEQALVLEPGHVESLFQLGRVYEVLGQAKKAVAAFARCIAAHPGHVEAFRRLRDLDPDAHTSVWSAHLADLKAKASPTAREYGLLAQAKLDAGDVDEARAILLLACKDWPDDAGPFRLYAFLERLSGNFQAALEAIGRAEALDPYDARIFDERLQILIAMGLNMEAQAYMDSHHHYFSSPTVARRAVGLLDHVAFGFGDLRKGFSAYSQVAPSELLRFHVGDKRFANSLESIREDERLLVLPAWGIGDEINWCSLYPEVAEHHPAVRFGAEPRLLPLLKRSFPNLEFLPIARLMNGISIPPACEADRFIRLPDLRLSQLIDSQGWEAIVNSDRVIMATALLGEMRGRSEQFRRSTPYFRPDPSKVAIWRARLDALGGGLKVGIAWTSSRITSMRRVHLTQLSDWGPVFDVRNAVFVSLQPGQNGEISAHGAPVHCFDGVDLLNDLDGSSALMAALDLVISVVNSSSALAGAVGVPTLLLNRASTLTWRVADNAGTDLIHSSQTHVRVDPLHDSKALMHAVRDLVAKRESQKAVNAA